MVMPYFELRKQSVRGTDSMAADIMRHLHARQHLGKTVVISNQSVALLAASRKQWLKLARLLQKYRASTLNADKILKYTHTITHMQHMRFTTKNSLQAPEAHVYFLEPQDVDGLPPQCYTAYITTPLDVQTSGLTGRLLASQALLVDYTGHGDTWEDLGLQPKRLLEAQVDHAWQQLCTYITGKGLDVTHLIDGSVQDIDAMDDALDTLLEWGHSFLLHATEFQRALELARPLRISKNVRQHYDALILLAHRVQALMPGAYSQQFLESYNEDDTFFLYELYRETLLNSGESLEDAILRNRAAGRMRLASAMQTVVNRRSLQRRIPTFGNSWL
jgi:hypothetical protein